MMSSRKMYFVMCGLVALLVCLLLGVLVIGNNQLQRQSEQLKAAKLDQQSLSEQQTALVKAKRDIEKYAELRDVAKSIVPQDKDQARAVREIDRYARESGVALKSIAFDDSTLGQQPAQPKAQPQQEGQATTPTPQTQTPPANPLTQAKPVPNIPGVYSMPIIITSADDVNRYPNFISFLSKLENNRRTAQVVKISITPVTKNGTNYVNFVLELNLFVKP